MFYEETVVCVCIRELKIFKYVFTLYFHHTISCVPLSISPLTILSFQTLSFSPSLVAPFPFCILTCAIHYSFSFLPLLVGASSPQFPLTHHGFAMFKSLFGVYEGSRSVVDLCDILFLALLLLQFQSLSKLLLEYYM